MSLTTLMCLLHGIAQRQSLIEFQIFVSNNLSELQTILEYLHFACNILLSMIKPCFILFNVCCSIYGCTAEKLSQGQLSLVSDCHRMLGHMAFEATVLAAQQKCFQCFRCLFSQHTVLRNEDTEFLERVSRNNCYCYFSFLSKGFGFSIN